MTKVAVVLGPPRTMTSGVARGMHLAGFDMGKRLLPANPSNPWGHYEDTELVALNDQLLHECGGSWSQPPDWPDPPDPEMVERAIEYLAGRGEPPWGCKDPRMVLLWPIWEAAFEYSCLDVIVIKVWRDPHMAQISLRRREAWGRDRAAQISDVYYDRISRIKG